MSDTISLTITLTNPGLTESASVSLRKQAKRLQLLANKPHTSVAEEATLMDIASILEGLAEDAAVKEGERTR